MLKFGGLSNLLTPLRGIAPGLKGSHPNDILFLKHNSMVLMSVENMFKLETFSKNVLLPTALVQARVTPLVQSKINYEHTQLQKAVAYLRRGVGDKHTVMKGKIEIFSIKFYHMFCFVQFTQFVDSKHLQN